MTSSHAPTDKNLEELTMLLNRITPVLESLIEHNQNPRLNEKVKKLTTEFTTITTLMERVAQAIGTNSVTGARIKTLLEVQKQMAQNQDKILLVVTRIETFLTDPFNGDV